MAVSTIGTNGTTTWSGFAWNPQSAPADIAQIANNIKTPSTPQKFAPGSFAPNGLLFLPERMVAPLKLLPGDWVVLTSTGWPIIIPAGAVAVDMTHVP